MDFHTREYSPKNPGNIPHKKKNTLQKYFGAPYERGLQEKDLDDSSLSGSFCDESRQENNASEEGEAEIEPIEVMVEIV